MQVHVPKIRIHNYFKSKYQSGSAAPVNPKESSYRGLNLAGDESKESTARGYKGTQSTVDAM